MKYSNLGSGSILLYIFMMLHCYAHQHAKPTLFCDTHCRQFPIIIYIYKIVVFVMLKFWPFSATFTQIHIIVINFCSNTEYNFSCALHSIANFIYFVYLRAFSDSYSLLINMSPDFGLNISRLLLQLFLCWCEE